MAIASTAASQQAACRTQYDENGFFVTPAVVPDNVIDAALAGIDEVIAGRYETGRRPYGKQWVPGDDLRRLVKIGQPHYSNRAILDLVTTPAVGEWAAAVSGASFVQAFAIDLFAKTPMKHDAANVGWHQDGPFLRMWRGPVFSAWIALSDVDETSAPLRYVRGSHRFGELSGVDFDDTDLAATRRQIEARSDLAWVEMPTAVPRGAIAFHHRLTLHASGPNLSTNRRIAIALRLRTEACEPTEPRVHPLVLTTHLDDPASAPVLKPSA